MGKKKSMLRVNANKDKNIHIDMENEIIKGFIVCSKGVTNDQRGEFDDAEISNLVSLGKDSNIGMKSRFGHPNMSSTALGTFLGRVKNFRRDKDDVRADLHLDPTAHKTPDGDLAQYVMDLARTDPDAFGASMVIDWDAEYKKKKYKDQTTGEVIEKDDYSVPPFIRVNKMFAVDVVDDPAATNGFFGKKFFNESVQLSADMTDFLDRFLQNPESVEQTMDFLKRYQNNSRNEIFQGLESDLEKIIASYADKRRGKKIKESFNALTLRFQECIEAIKDLPNFDEQKYRNKSFASELFDKFNLSNKSFGNFHYVKQWWKPRFIEGKQIEEYILLSDNGFNIHMEQDILTAQTPVSMFIKETKVDLFARISESVEYLPAQESQLNETTMPSWIKPLSSGKICIQESSSLEKKIEVIIDDETHFLKCVRESENSDFWKISKLSSFFKMPKLA